jgi:Cd2+/Zn2+-exporting ATPase
MGVNGSDAALETADVVLMGDDLSKLPTLIGLSRKAMSIVKQNIVIALSLKLLFLILSIGGVASLWMAVLADDGAALVVILNGLRVLSLKEDV